jgi:transcription elongation factor GreA
VDEVRAVEQDPETRGAALAGELAECAHRRVVAARDSSHGACRGSRIALRARRRQHNRLCYSLNPTMKERILKRFTDEIAALERELKVELPKEIQRARELGDLRENAEYKAAKDRQDIVNARIAMLKRRVGEISMINLDRIPHDRAGIGSTVQLRDEGGDLVVYQLVMPEEADVEKGLISTSSPIGRAILNKEEGDEIKVTTPSGKRTFELVKLTTIHHEA